MSENKPFQRKLHYLFHTGKHAGKTLQWCIENDIEYIKYLHKKNIIAFDPVAWDEFLIAAKGKETYKKSTTTLYKRHTRR